MKQITCVHCGDTYPDFDVAHVCSKGPYAPKLKPRMNERILKLARKSGATVNEGFDGTKNFVYGITMSPEELEKFAELIVKECLAIAKNREDELENANLLKESNAVGIVKYRIARQFGVKE
jgi:hypothetical protein